MFLIMDEFKPHSHHLPNLNEGHPPYHGSAHAARVNSSSLHHMTSTPKHPQHTLTFSHSNLHLGNSGSSGSLQISDTEEEENNNFQSSIDRINSIPRPKKPTNSRFSSRSLPVTPRVNGSYSSSLGHSSINSGSSSTHGSGNVVTPFLMAPHLAPHYSLEGSYHSMGTLSPANSQYVTCSSGFLSESQEKVLPGSIDYSSLPLPKDESFRVTHKRSISRHLSEPSIHQAATPRHLSSAGKFHSCPQRKSSLKGRKRDVASQSRDSDLLEGIQESNPTSSLNGIEQKLDELESMGTQWKFIRTLVDELNSSQALNNRMAIELHQAKLEIQMLNTALESCTDAGSQPGVVSEMIGQIHAAQKFRDEAMMSRIKLANEERDAVITHSQTLLEKMGVSTNGGLNSLDDRDVPQQRLTEPNINLATLEEELKALRLAYVLQDTIQEKQNKEENQGSNSNHEAVDELKAKLCHSDAARWQLQERCTRMESIFDAMRRKVDGFCNVETLNQNDSSLTLVDMTLFVPPELPIAPSDNASSNRVNDTCGGNKEPAVHNSNKVGSSKTSSGTSSTSDEPKDSLSSMESVETTSVSSWKKGSIDLHRIDTFQQHNDKQNTSGHIKPLHNNTQEMTEVINCPTECPPPFDVNYKHGTDTERNNRNPSFSQKRKDPIASNKKYYTDLSKEQEFVNGNVYEYKISIKGPITEL